MKEYSLAINTLLYDVAKIVRIRGMQLHYVLMRAKRLDAHTSDKYQADFTTIIRLRNKIANSADEKIKLVLWYICSVHSILDIKC
jgi:hypothetical protein